MKHTFSLWNGQKWGENLSICQLFPNNEKMMRRLGNKPSILQQSHLIFTTRCKYSLFFLRDLCVFSLFTSVLVSCYLFSWSRLHVWHYIFGQSCIILMISQNITCWRNVNLFLSLHYRWKIVPNYRCSHEEVWASDRPTINKSLIKFR